jgi:hypothetical protein
MSSLLLVLLLGCDRSGSLDLNVTDPDAPADYGTISLSVPPAFDPVLGGPATIEVVVEEVKATPIVEIYDAAGALVRPLEMADLRWDGRDAAGLFVPGGRYTVRASVETPTGKQLSAEAELGVVRVGFGAIWAEDDGGATAERLDLYWSGAKQLQDWTAPISSLADLEDDDGVALDLPTVTVELASPSAGAAEPVAYTWDSRPVLTLSLGSSSSFPEPGLLSTDVRVKAEGWTVLSGSPLRSGEPLTIQRDAALGDGVGLIEEELKLTFVVDREDGLERALGSQTVPLRFYALLGAETFIETKESHTAWPAAIEPALRAIDGAAPDHDAVVSALVTWIFDDLGLSYDTRSGASAYVYYRNYRWDQAQFDFTGFLKRKSGSVINCTDAAAILMTYANMLGAEHYYSIILQDFTLNYLLAIGGDEFVSCPFGSGICGFSYHAVTVDEEGESVWDATLALDGDDDPGTTPNSVLYVQAIEAEEYLDRLVRSGRAEYGYDAQGTIQ